jgi:hypothetical protein
VIAANPALDQQALDHLPEPAEAAPAPAASPPAPDDNALLLAVLDPSHSTLDLCSAFGLSIPALKAFLDRPDIAQALEDFLEINHRRTRIFAAQHSAAAIQTIASIAQDQRPENVAPETARKSASHLLRLATPKKEPRAQEPFAPSFGSPCFSVVCAAE